MDVFYNLTGIGDILLIPLKKSERHDVLHEKYGDIIKIWNNNGDILGYNIFRASTHFHLPDTSGKIAMTEELLGEIKQLFHKQKLDDDLVFDLSPKFVVGYVIDKKPHENADKLSVCQVDVGDETLQIVCGAANVSSKQKVVVAKVGATMPSGLRIKPTELRGVPSNGMICSREELNVPIQKEEKGIYVLDDSYKVGNPFTF